MDTRKITVDDPVAIEKMRERTKPVSTEYKTGENAVGAADGVRMPRGNTTTNNPRVMSKAARRMGRRNYRLNRKRW